MKKTKSFFLFMVVSLFLLVSMIPSNVYASKLVYNSSKNIPVDVRIFCNKNGVHIDYSRDYYITGKKHKAPHYFLPVPYYYSNPTCKTKGYAWLKCADANCKARRMYRTSLKAHTLNGKETLIKKGTCKRPAVYKIVCTSCGDEIKVRRTVGHDWITKKGHIVCKYCKKNGDDIFTSN